MSYLQTLQDGEDKSWYDGPLSWFTTQGEDILNAATGAGKKAIQEEIEDLFDVEPDKPNAGGSTAIPEPNSKTQTPQEKMTADLNGMSKAGWDLLSTAQKDALRAKAKELGITIPWDSTAGKAKDTMGKIPALVPGAAVGGGTYYFTKSIIGAILSGGATTFLWNKYINK